MKNEALDGFVYQVRRRVHGMEGTNGSRDGLRRSNTP